MHNTDIEQIVRCMDSVGSVGNNRRDGEIDYQKIPEWWAMYQRAITSQEVGRIVPGLGTKCPRPWDNQRNVEF